VVRISSVTPSIGNSMERVPHMEAKDLNEEVETLDAVQVITEVVLLLLAFSLFQFRFHVPRGAVINPGVYAL